MGAVAVAVVVVVACVAIIVSAVEPRFHLASRKSRVDAMLFRLTAATQRFNGQSVTITAVSFFLFLLYPFLFFWGGGGNHVIL
jgi:FlaG/FlaF family flagellin (archaellin)